MKGLYFMSHEVPLWQHILKSGMKLTPMMTQYTSIKEQYPDTFVFFRMGDFYELFFDDAQKVSNLLQITLTQRGKIGDYSIPMAGIPFHSAGSYVDKLTQQGYRIAICEQVEDPKQAQGIVKREVVQIVGPGIPYDLEKADAFHHRYIVTMAEAKEQYFVVFLDYSTGDFFGEICYSLETVMDHLDLYAPKEFLTYQGQWDHRPLLNNYIRQQNILVTTLHPDFFNIQQSAHYIEKLIPNYERDDVLNHFSSSLLIPIGAMSYYICSTQKQQNYMHVRAFRMEAEHGKMTVTHATLKGLEIIPKDKEHYKDSLLGFFDQTKTSLGAREFKKFFHTPLTDLKEISARQQLIQTFCQNQETLTQIISILEHIRDFERILAKVSSRKAIPRDLINLSKGIQAAIELVTMMKNEPYFHLFSIHDLLLEGLKKLAHLIETTLNDDHGACADKGNIIKQGLFPERDRLVLLALHHTQALDKLEEQYRQQTQISTLKIKYNHIHGYFIEISKSHLHKVPSSFHRKQTLVNGERYITDELSLFEKEVLSAKALLEQFEKSVVEDILTEIKQHANSILSLSRFVAYVDIFQSLAVMALKEDLVIPNFSHEKKMFSIQGAFHPLIKNRLRNQFVSHDLYLDDKCLFGLITGPNMAGKTTCMREMAIIQFLAQLGSFVPAKQATVTICDQIFSRLGASDDILKGHSTFMVEMAETAEILRHATTRSFIIMDEVGRGTSTYDGLSIAWALVSHFIEKTQAFVLFSTHYHELVELVDQYSTAKNLTVETVVNEDRVEFLYHLKEGHSTQSYGLYVAKLAGLPEKILDHAKVILDKLEHYPFNQSTSLPTKKTRRKKKSPHEEKIKKTKEIQLCFFPQEMITPKVTVIEAATKKTKHNHQRPPKLLPSKSEMDLFLSELDLQQISPMDLFQKIHQLKNQRTSYDLH
jgi:DNA mismatch repair protein MutS